MILLFLTFHCNILAQSQINWKQYFTFEPNEGKNFVLDSSAVVFNASVPGINIANDGKVILGWSSTTPNRKAGISFDSGKTFSQLFSIQQPMQIDGGFIYLPNGKTRFLTEEPAPDKTPQRHKSRIISYISSDGYNWIRENGIRYQPNEADDSISSVCEVIQIKDSLWRMYYVGDWYRTNGIRTALSTNWGLTWNAESINNILRKGDVDPHPVYLSNGRIRLYFRSGMNKPPSQSGISFCDSENGLEFDTTKINFIIADSTFPQSLKLDPMVIKYPDGKIACYIGSSP
ncbi:MAG: hypothetical protein N3A61_07270, partial [Ignavibacteria bacterium]|nr:hypothetical protein [Ignavibacteria bacterium]